MGSLPSDWVDEHVDALYRYAVTRVNDPHVAEDLIQETLLAAYRAREGFRHESSVRTWLIAILRLKIVDYYRRSARDSRLSSLSEDACEACDQRHDRLDAWDCKPANSLESQEFWDVLRACVGKLPKTLAAAFWMRELDQLPVAEVCDALQISNQNLATRLFRARAGLRDCLDRNWFSRD